MAALTLFTGWGSRAHAQAPGPAPPPSGQQRIELAEVDRLAWDRLGLMEQLAQAREELQRTQNFVIVSRERAALDARLRKTYQIGINDLTRHPDGSFTRKEIPETIPAK